MSLEASYTGFSDVTSLTLGGTMLRRFEVARSATGNASGGYNKIIWGLNQASFSGVDSPILVYTPFVTLPVYSASRNNTITVEPSVFDPGQWTIRGTMQGIVGEVAGNYQARADFPVVRRLDKTVSSFNLITAIADNIDGEVLTLSVVGTMLDLASLPEHMAEQLALSYTLSA